MDFYDRLQSVCNSKGVKITNLCLETTGNKGNIRTWKGGHMMTDVFYKCLEILGFEYAEYLLGISDNINPTASDNDYIMCPVYGNVSAGNGVLADNDIVDYAPAYNKGLTDDKEYFYLTVHGDSMYPTFFDGDRILVERTTVVDSGKYAVALVDGQEGLVKRVIYDDNHIELSSVNSAYPPRVFSGSDIERVSILGLVKRVERAV